MKTTEERLLKMHQRADEIKRHRELTGIGILGTLSGALLIGLIVVMQQTRGIHHTVITGQSTGSSLLSDSVGGYVLIAVIAFLAGTIITAVAIRSRNRGRQDQGTREE